MSCKCSVLCFVVVCIVLSFAGCATRGNPSDGWDRPETAKVWPERPGQYRIELLRVVSSEADLKKKSDYNGFLKWLLGSSLDVQPLISPYGISADGNGRVWVSDPGGGVVKVFDLARGRVDYIGQAGSVPFVSPVDVAYVSAQKSLYVSDSSLGKVFHFDADGEYVSTLVPPVAFGRPAGMAVGPEGRLYVVDVVKGVVAVFDSAGQYLQSIGSASSESGLFNHPSNVEVDSLGRIYVVDSLRFRVEVQADDGTLLALIGDIGDGPGSFARPRGVAVDSSGHIYVADAAFDNIQIFDLAGQLLLNFGQPGKHSGEFCLPAGLHIDDKDRIYVAEACNNRFQIFQYLEH